MFPGASAKEILRLEYRPISSVHLSANQQRPFISQSAASISQPISSAHLSGNQHRLFTSQSAASIYQPISSAHLLTNQQWPLSANQQRPFISQSAEAIANLSSNQPCPIINQSAASTCQPISRANNIKNCQYFYIIDGSGCLSFFHNFVSLICLVFYISESFVSTGSIEYGSPKCIKTERFCFVEHLFI